MSGCRVPRIVSWFIHPQTFWKRNIQHWPEAEWNDYSLRACFFFPKKNILNIFLFSKYQFSFRPPFSKALPLRRITTLVSDPKFQMKYTWWHKLPRTITGRAFGLLEKRWFGCLGTSRSVLSGSPTRTACHAAKCLLHHTLSFFFHSSLFRNISHTSERVSAMNGTISTSLAGRPVGWDQPSASMSHSPVPQDWALPGQALAGQTLAGRADPQPGCLPGAGSASTSPTPRGRQEPPTSQNFRLESHTVPHPGDSRKGSFPCPWTIPFPVL